MRRMLKVLVVLFLSVIFLMNMASCEIVPGDFSDLDSSTVSNEVTSDIADQTNPAETTTEDNPPVTPPPHTHTVVTDPAIAATCTTTGLTEGSHCSECDEIIVSQNEVPVLGHTAGAAATCTTAQTCTSCDYVFQAALGHTWDDANCTTPKTCSVCKATEGEALGHTWDDANCITPKTCSVCQATEGEALGHTWEDANCITPKTCSVCKTTEGEALGHTWEDANCITPKTCSICGATEGEALGHTWDDANCTTPKTCSVCKVTEGEALGHTWVDANCTTPKTCSLCGKVDGSVSAKHAISDSGICTVCGESFIISVEEAIEIGMTYEKGKYSNEYYYVQLTLNDQVNPNGFARAKISDGLYVSVAGDYKTNPAYVEGTIKLGDTVIFKAKLGAVNSNLTTGGKELRLYEVATYKIHNSHTPGDNFVCSICGKSILISVEEAIKIGMSYEKGKYSDEYYYVQLTLNDQVNPNGFARAKISDGLYISVAGNYKTNPAYVEGTIKLGDTVIFKAKLGAVNSNLTTGGKELRLYEVAAFTIHDGEHVHVYGTEVNVLVPATCATEGKGTVSCSCGDTKEIVIPTNDSHVLNDDFACSVCGKYVTISIEEAVEIGMSYEKGKYSSEYYHIQLTLDDQVNPNGFARAFISDGFYFSVAGGYLTGDAEGSIQLGNTVIFKAKIGAVNSAVAIDGKEPRLYEVAAYKIVASQNINISTTLDGKSDIVSHNATYADFTEVNKAPAGVTFDFGYLYVKKSGNAAIEKSALVWNTYGKYSNISFDLYVNKITDSNGNAGTEVEFQLSAGARFVSVIDANGKEVSVVYTESPYVVLQKGQSYHIVINVSDITYPTFYFGFNNKTCELYLYNFSIEKSQFEYIINNAEQTIVCKKDGETYGYFAWPTVTKIGGTRLMAVASGMRSAHTGMDGKLVCWYSEDEGKTWSEPQLLMDTVLDDRDAGVVYWNGKIIVSWFCASQAYYNQTVIDNALDTELMGGNYIISEDGGNTWSDIYYMPDGMFTPHGLIINPNGGLTSVGYLKYDKINKRWGTGIAVRTTTGEMDENGFIWSDAIVIADSDTQYSWDFQEPYGIYNDDGVLIVVMRSATGLYQCELQPGATKFSNWHLIAYVQETPAHMIQHSSGVMIMTYGYRGIYIDPVTGKTVSYTERNKDGSLGIRARFSYDGGLTWTQEIILSYGLKPTSDNTSDWGYTSSVELSDGRILTLFYQRTLGETKASIYQIIWEVPAAPSGEITITFVGGNDGGDKKITTATGNVGEAIVLPATPTYPGFKFDGWYLDYAYTIPFTATTYSKDLIIYAKWAIDEKQSLPVMSFNVKVHDLSEILGNSPRADLVVNTILENNPYVFGVQEADDLWMSKLNGKLGHLYTSVGKGRDGNSGEHSAIFYRTDMFNLIESGTKWLSSTPDKAGSKYSYAEGGTTYTANYPRIMTYVVLERKSDGAKFIYVNAHLDNNGDNNGTVAENIRKGQVEVLLGEIQKLYKTHGNLPTIVTGDFNAQPGTASYTTMIQNGFADSSKVAKQSEIKRTFNGNSDSGNVIFDYVFVSSDLAKIVQTYDVCPEKRDGKWISDHNAIIANIVIPVA